MKKIILAVILGLAVICLLFYSLVLKQDDKPQHEIEETVQNKCLSLMIGCTGKIDNVTFNLKFPSNIIYLRPFPIELNFIGDTPLLVESVRIEFRMLKMKMATNAYLLEKDDRNPTLWRGEGMLPICASGRVDWQAFVEIKVKNKTYKRMFTFEVLPLT